MCSFYAERKATSSGSLVSGQGLSPSQGVSVRYTCIDDNDQKLHFWNLIQARSPEGFEGVRTNPPCSLAKFIFNETAAVVQGTIIQPCSGHTSHHAAATRGSHIHVACRSVCDRDQEFRSVKIVLDRLIAPFRGSGSLDHTTKAM